jgi:ribonuclease H-related protein
MAIKKKKYYAYFLSEKQQGVTDSWSECEKLVSKAKNARYRGFSSRSEAEAWLGAGARYESKKTSSTKLAASKAKGRVDLQTGIYFDAGTGRGHGVEISVTDEQGRNLLHAALPKEKINKFGKHLLPRAMTNNYGELLACYYALQIAMETGAKKVFGDSQLILTYWSKGFMKRGELPPLTVALADSVKELRKKFEHKGGEVAYIPGGDNPADLGFHR